MPRHPRPASASFNDLLRFGLHAHPRHRGVSLGRYARLYVVDTIRDPFTDVFYPTADRPAAHLEIEYRGKIILSIYHADWHPYRSTNEPVYLLGDFDLWDRAAQRILTLYSPLRIDRRSGSIVNAVLAPDTWQPPHVPNILFPQRGMLFARARHSDAIAPCYILNGFRLSWDLWRVPACSHQHPEENLA